MAVCESGRGIELTPFALSREPINRGWAWCLALHYERADSARASVPCRARPSHAGESGVCCIAERHRPPHHSLLAVSVSQQSQTANWPRPSCRPPPVLHGTLTAKQGASLVPRFVSPCGLTSPKRWSFYHHLLLQLHGISWWPLETFSEEFFLGAFAAAHTNCRNEWDECLLWVSETTFTCEILIQHFLSPWHGNCPAIPMSRWKKSELWCRTNIKPAS